MSSVLLQTDLSDDELDTMQDKDILAMLSECWAVTVSRLQLMARLVKQCDKRGIDLATRKEFKSQIHDLRRIADGQMLAEVPVRFAKKPSLIAKIGSLSLAEQQRLADGEPVKLLTYGPDGKITHQMADPLEMDAAQIAQVFAQDHIRTEEEQATKLEARRVKSGYRGPEKIGDGIIDRERGGVMVGKRFVPLHDLVKWVKALQE